AHRNGSGERRADAGRVGSERCCATDRPAAAGGVDAPGRGAPHRPPAPGRVADAGGGESDRDRLPRGSRVGDARGRGRALGRRGAQRPHGRDPRAAGGELRPRLRGAVRPAARRGDRDRRLHHRRAGGEPDRRRLRVHPRRLPGPAGGGGRLHGEGQRDDRQQPDLHLGAGRAGRRHRGDAGLERALRRADGERRGEDLRVRRAGPRRLAGRGPAHGAVPVPQQPEHEQHDGHRDRDGERHGDHPLERAAGEGQAPGRRLPLRERRRDRPHQRGRLGRGADQRKWDRGQNVFENRQLRAGWEPRLGCGVRAMTDLAPGDILIGGLGHIDIIHPNGTLERRPIVDALGKPLQVNGIAVSPSGHYQFAASPPGETINRPHDIAYLPDGSGYIEIGQASPRSAQLWKFDLAGNRVGTWTIETDDGWTTGLLRLDVAPDGKTVYYTDSGRTIFRFDISTDDGMQLQPFDKLPMDSPNIYAGFKLLSDGGIVLAMSKTGNGPRDAVCLDNDRTSFWTDEVNPAVPGQYHIYRRSLADSGNKIDTYPNPDEGYLEYEVMCLACYLRGDARYGVHSKARSNAGPPVASSCFADVRNLGVGRVRTEIRYTLFPQAADCDASDTTIDQALDPIGVALAAYKRAAVEPLAILASGILGVDLSTDFRPGGTGLCPATGKNYFQAFSDRAATIASKLHTLAGVTCFEIWNEPNVPLTPDG